MILDNRNQTVGLEENDLLERVMTRTVTTLIYN